MANKNTSPNILVILDDQHRFDFLGTAGAPFVDTPNIDRLANRGMVFTHCCTNSPLCAPARIALATGLLPTRTGALENYHYLPLSAANHYRHFRDNGYRVELVGRHDLAKEGAPGSIYGNRPLNFSIGFTRAWEVEGGMACAREGYASGKPTGPYTKYLEEKGLFKKYVDDFMHRRSKGWIIKASHDSVLAKEHHQDTFIGRKAVERIENQEEDYPFYMFVNFQSPHDPFDPPKDLGDKYRDRDVPEAIAPQLEDKPRRIRELLYGQFKHADREDIRVARRQYCAKVELIDEQVGLILNALEKKGILENTIVIFGSDHGELLGDHGLFQKQTAYESSMRVPLIIAGPGIQQGRNDSLVELFDVNPTLVEMAGLPNQRNIDARSFAAILKGESSEHRENCVTCQSTYRAMRTKRYKYIESYNDTYELYDLEEDIQEVRNIISQKPELVKEFQKALKERFLEGKWNR